MGFRRSIVNILLGPPEVTADDLARIKEQSTAPAPGGADPELDARMAKLEKKLNMAMGAVQAATAQIMSLKKDLEEVANSAKQANQAATTARNTAESTADGLTGIEEQLAALVEQLGKAESPKPEKKAKTKKRASTSSKKKDDPGCKVDGCTNKHRARGYCAKHYQQLKRGTLEE